MIFDGKLGEREQTIIVADDIIERHLNLCLKFVPVLWDVVD